MAQSSYHNAAYSDDRMEAALTAAGYASLRECVAKLATQGKTLSETAAHLNLNAQRFCAYYHKWAQQNVPPLRLGECDDDD